MRTRSCWYLKEGEGREWGGGGQEPECSGKNLPNQDESQQQTQPTHDDNTRTKTRATLVDSQPLSLTQAQPHEVIVVNAIEHSAGFESPIV